MDVVVAVHGREIRTALFLALNSLSSIDIVATAASTGELTSYWKSFRPDLVIVESDLPGRPLPDILRDLDRSTNPPRILVVEGSDELRGFEGISGVETLRDVDQLLEILNTADSEEGTQ